MTTPLWTLLAAGLIPMLIASIWYHPSLFGNASLNSSFKNKSIFYKGFSLVLFWILGVFLAFGLTALTNHIVGVMQLFLTHPDFTNQDSEVYATYNHLLTQYGDRHRSFAHGVVHGIINSVLIVAPILGIHSILKSGNFKSFLVSFFYWLIVFILVGGLVCHFQV